ncbi:hypothetical protein [Desulfobotulus sp.]|uniref:hypothetical protein n=1 Tax=Desulfobotulus sp. TaxID=1940337 RepID=UPI002A365FEE|nr:hypothetical protein [Desulfobotulus sp.]MDY0164509.1 hypothetical protein [Desulfobotulus sp.]
MMDIGRFLAAKTKPRTRDFPAPEGLKVFFEDPAQAAFQVRGLTGEELARVRAAVERNRDMQALVEKFFGGREERLSAMKDVLGLSPDSLPDDLARRITMVALGCASPELDEQAAARLFEVQPVFAYQLSDAILNLTGEGAALGE